VDRVSKQDSTIVRMQKAIRILEDLWRETSTRLQTGQHALARDKTLEPNGHQLLAELTAQNVNLVVAIKRLERAEERLNGKT
jgi:hypothetical protein